MQRNTNLVGRKREKLGQNAKLKKIAKHTHKNTAPYIEGAVMELVKALDYQNNYEEKIKEATAFLRKQLGKTKPVFGIVLGSGMSSVAEAVKNQKIINYKDIPNFPKPSIKGHEGELIIGEIQEVPVIVLKGRKHYYEVADKPFNTGMLEVIFPVHLLAELGVKIYLATSAVGGLNPEYKVGDLIIITSHISMIPNPLLGRQHDFRRVDNEEKTPRFQPMHDAYDEELRKMLIKAASPYKNYVHEGVLLAVTGPSYETLAEGVFFRKSVLADAVGMSIAPEVVVARNRGMRAAALSCITDIIREDGSNPTSHEEVLAVMNSPEVKQRLKNLIEEFFKLYKDSKR